MGINITDVITWTTPIVSIADGDDADEVSFATAPQGLANRTAFLRAHVLGADASEPITFPLLAMPQDPTVNGWFLDQYGGTGAFGLVQANVASNNLVLELIQPKACQLTALTAYIVGASGHGALPATMPSMKLYRQDTTSTGAPTLIDTATDGSASVGAYEAIHPLTLSGLTEDMAHDSGNRFFVVITSEASTNALAGLTLLDLHGTANPS